MAKRYFANTNLEAVIGFVHKMRTINEEEITVVLEGDEKTVRNDGCTRMEERFQKTMQKQNQFHMVTEYIKCGGKESKMIA